MLLGCQQGLLHRIILAMDMVRTRKTKTSMRRGHFVLLKLFACSCSTLFFSVVAAPPPSKVTKLWFVRLEDLGATLGAWLQIL